MEIFIVWVVFILLGPKKNVILLKKSTIIVNIAKLIKIMKKKMGKNNEENNDQYRIFLIWIWFVLLILVKKPTLTSNSCKKCFSTQAVLNLGKVLLIALQWWIIIMSGSKGSILSILIQRSTLISHSFWNWLWYWINSYGLLVFTTENSRKFFWLTRNDYQQIGMMSKCLFLIILVEKPTLCSYSYKKWLWY